jgi:hypothetical protein
LSKENGHRNTKRKLSYLGQGKTKSICQQSEKNSFEHTQNIRQNPIGNVSELNDNLRTLLDKEVKMVEIYNNERDEAEESLILELGFEKQRIKELNTLDHSSKDSLHDKDEKLLEQLVSSQKDTI